jgi:predicted  nucleic acid-binding Zn-ribbon protein
MFTHPAQCSKCGEPFMEGDCRSLAPLCPRCEVAKLKKDIEEQKKVKVAQEDYNRLKNRSKE